MVERRSSWSKSVARKLPAHTVPNLQRDLPVGFKSLLAGLPCHYGILNRTEPSQTWLYQSITREQWSILESVTSSERIRSNGEQDGFLLLAHPHEAQWIKTPISLGICKLFDSSCLTQRKVGLWTCLSYTVEFELSLPV